MISTDLAAGIAAHHARQTARQEAIRAARAASCPWCEIYVRSAAGLCTCTDACGVITCPARNADEYVRPEVPTFPGRSA